MTARIYLAIAAGSVLGSLLRWGVAQLFPLWLGDTFPWATLFVNLTGSFLICFYAARFAAGGPVARGFVMSGICGGYTTFSLLSLEMLNLLRMNRTVELLIYVGLTIAGSLACGWLGAHAGTRRQT